MSKKLSICKLKDMTLFSRLYGRRCSDFGDAPALGLAQQAKILLSRFLYSVPGSDCLEKLLYSVIGRV